ncbi:MAG: VOC family protein [Ancalomicrobiaceae bacterium]|nr:VOC family protein [Ancalomicrobiaceae bacterium]
MTTNTAVTEPQVLPAGLGARGIDHLVVAVNDLDAGRDVWQALGFTLTPRAQHPWGTANHLAQLDHSFVELLGLDDAAKIKPAGRNGFSFGAFNRDFLKKHQGASMLVLESTDADADIADFAAAGLDTFSRFDFERMAGQPGGGQARVAFSLAFTRPTALKTAGFFTCQNHEPEHFWHAEWQRHANSAVGIDEVTLVAPDPADYHIFLSRFTGVREIRASSSGISIATPRGRVAVVTPVAFRYLYGEDSLAVVPKTLEIRGITFAVADFGQSAAALVAGGLKVADRHDRLLVGPAAALGLAVAFKAEARTN